MDDHVDAGAVQVRPELLLKEGELLDAPSALAAHEELLGHDGSADLRTYDIAIYVFNVEEYV